MIKLKVIQLPPQSITLPYYSESEKTPAVDPTAVTEGSPAAGEDVGDTPISPDNLSMGSDKARTADEGLGGSETFAENEPVGSPIPSAFSISVSLCV